MKRLFALIRSVVGFSRLDAKGQDSQTIDPNKILFTIPTLSDDLAPVEQVQLPIPDSAFTMHEDDWCQVEFFPKARLPQLHRMLKEYKSFERINRSSFGWKNVYVRRIERVPVLSGEQALTRLGSMFSSTVGQAPILHATTSLTGQVTNGFTMPLGGNIWLYGFVSDEEVPVLAALVGEHPDDAVLTAALCKLSHAEGLVLVDWKQQLVLTGVYSAGMVEVWRP